MRRRACIVHPRAQTIGAPPAQSVSRRAALRTMASVAALGGSALAASGSAYDAEYDAYAEQYDALDGSTALTRMAGFDALRRDLVGRASGRTLEVGVGTGLNLPLYSHDKVESVVGLDASGEMLRRATEKIGGGGGVEVPIELVQGRAEAMQLRDGSFDTVVDTFSLCVFAEPEKALREMKRVLAASAEAKVLLLEHSISSWGPLAWYQNLTASAVAATSKGCFPNQDVCALCRDAGFSIHSVERHIAGTVVSLELRVKQ